MTTSSPLGLARLFQSNVSENVWFQTAWLMARVLASLLMIHNGLNKLADVPGFAEGVVRFIGLPFPVFLTYCAAYVEIFGAILLALGLLTRINAGALLLTMFVAIFFHIKGDGWQIPPLETASLYALLFLFFLVNGAGAFSLDTVIQQRLLSSKTQNG